MRISGIIILPAAAVFSSRFGKPGDRIVSLRAIGCGRDIADKVIAQKADSMLALKDDRNFSNWRPCYLRLAVHNQNDLAALAWWRYVGPRPKPCLTALKAGPKRRR
jgi:hypothetical protein